MVDAQTCLRLRAGVTYQSLGAGQDTVVLALASGYLFTCNQTTADFLGALDGRRTVGQVAAALGETLDVPRATLLADLLAVAERLRSEELIEVVA